MAGDAGGRPHRALHPPLRRLRPSYPGHYDGELLHSHDFKSATPFKGKRVLVIGGGNSACDIAVETGRVAQRTCISMRRGYWFVPKFLMGMPTDVLNVKVMRRLPKGLRQSVHPAARPGEEPRLRPR